MKTIAEEHATSRGAMHEGRRWQHALLACLLAGLALMCGPAMASATPEMRGEWGLVLTSSAGTVKGTALIEQQANASGEFASSSVMWEGVDPGTFTGTLGATEASVVITAQAYGPYPPTEFTSNSIQIQESGSSLVLTGQGTTKQGSTSLSTTLTATRIKTYQEVEEQREREQREREEAEAREAVRGEWELVLSSGPQVVHGIARITEAANAKNEFASQSALFEGAIAGSFAGTLEGSQATVTIATQATGPYPASTFTSSSIAVSRTAGSMSMSGSGTFEAGGASAPATLTATRIKSYTELKQQEAQEKLAQEAKEREAKEAQERLEREAQEKRLREAAASQTTGSSGTSGGSTSILPARLAGTTLTVNGSGSLWLGLTNPNSLPVHGRVTLAMLPGKSNKAASKRAKPKRLLVASASFTISAAGHVRVAMRLTKAGRALLAHHKTFRVVAKVRTEASGMTATSKGYVLTLRAASHGRAHS